MTQNHKHKFRKLNRSTGGNIVVFLILSVMAFFMLLPLLFSISSAFKPPEEIFLFPPTLIVRSPTLENFRQLFTFLSSSWVPFSRYVFNSLFVTVVGSFVAIMISCAAAYPLSKIPLPGKKWLFSLVVLAIMLSRDVAGVTSFLLFNSLGMLNTFYTILIPVWASSFGVFLVKQFADAMIPDTVLEAVKIDGANEYTIFLRIVMPIIKPAWLTLLIFTVQSLWNDSGALIYTENMKTLPYVMNQITASGLVSRTGPAAAATLLTMSVPVICFILAQSNVIATFATSGIKE